MAIRKILSSRFIIGYLLMVVCIVTFNSCNRTPCEGYRGYAPRYYSTLDKFVWTGCNDPNISVIACEFKDVDKSRYIVVQYMPDRNTYLPIRGPYPDPDEVNQFVEQANGDYYFVNVDDFTRQSTSASNGEYNYGGAAHRFAGTAIMIDYRYAEAKADALAHYPCGVSGGNYDCMSSGLKQSLSDCFYSEDEEEDTEYVPYTIDHTACTAGDNFRVGAANTITIEDCSPPYYIDTFWFKDQIVAGSGDRTVYMGVSIDPFDPTKRYALYIEDGTTVIYKGELGYFNGNTHIAEVDPKREPRSPESVQFTVRAKLWMNASPLGNPQQRTYTVSVKNFVDNINTPTGQVVGITPVQVELKNRFPYQGVDNRERVMSIQLFGNSGTSFNSNMKDYGFQTTFTNVWTNSDIHAYPNYLPTAYRPSTTTGVPNPTPGNTVLPNYVIDSDGYGVVLDTDFTDSDLSSDEACYEDLVDHWDDRFQVYVSNLVNNQLTNVNTLQKLDNIRETSAPPYQNQVSVLGVRGFRIYEVDPATGELKKKAPPNPTGALEPDITPTKLLPGGGTLTAYRAALQSGTLGVTLSFNADEVYNPVVVVDIGLIQQLSTGSEPLSTKVMAVVMHELAHAWFNQKVTDPALEDGTAPGAALSHAAYIKGEGSQYCLMRYCPTGQEPQMGTLSTTVMTTFFTRKYRQMAFSRSIQQRLANVMAVTYDN